MTNLLGLMLESLLKCFGNSCHLGFCSSSTLYEVGWYTHYYSFLEHKNHSLISVSCILFWKCIKMIYTWLYSLSAMKINIKWIKLHCYCKMIYCPNKDLLAPLWWLGWKRCLYHGILFLFFFHPWIVWTIFRNLAYIYMCLPTKLRT